VAEKPRSSNNSLKHNKGEVNQGGRRLSKWESGKWGEARLKGDDSSLLKSVLRDETQKKGQVERGKLARRGVIQSSYRKRRRRCRPKNSLNKSSYLTLQPKRRKNQVTSKPRGRGRRKESEGSLKVSGTKEQSHVFVAEQKTSEPAAHRLALKESNQMTLLKANWTGGTPSWRTGFPRSSHLKGRLRKAGGYS